MRYSTEPRFRKYDEGYGFLSFAKNSVINMVKKVMDTATKTGINATKSASKWVVQKTTEATDLIRNKTADKITSTGKSKGKNKESRRNLHSNKKKQQNIDDLKVFWA